MIRPHITLNMTSNPFWNKKEYKNQAHKLNKYPSTLSILYYCWHHSSWLWSSSVVLWLGLVELKKPWDAAKSSVPWSQHKESSKSGVWKEVSLNLLHQWLQAAAQANDLTSLSLRTSVLVLLWRSTVRNKCVGWVLWNFTNNAKSSLCR